MSSPIINPTPEVNKLFSKVLENKAYRQDNILLDGYAAVKSYADYMKKIEVIRSSIYSAYEEGYYNDYALVTKIHGKMIDVAKKTFQGNFRIYSKELVQAIRYIESEDFTK